MNNEQLLYILIITGFLFFLVLFVFIFPLHYFLLARFSGIKLSVQEVVFLKLRRISVSKVVKALILSNKAGLNIKLSEIEVSLLAGANIENIVLGLMAAKESGINIKFNEAVELDLKGKNILKEVKKRKKLTVFASN